MKAQYLLIAFFFFILSTSIFAQDEFTTVKEGDKAPDFTYEIEPGKTQNLSDLEGKVVWINFFATWCGPCRRELPHLQKDVYDKYIENDDFVLIILGREHSWEEVNKFKAEQDFSMPFYPDPKREIFAMFAQQNIPRNFIIDKEGKVALSSVGFNEEDFEKIKSKVDELIRQ